MDSAKSNQVNFDEELLTLIREGENERAKKIIENVHLYHSVDASNSTLLHHSVRYGNGHITQFLLDKKCNVNAQDSLGNTPLMIVMETRNQVLLQILLSSEADIFLLNHEQKSALDMLGICNDTIMYQLFLPELRKRCSTSEEAATKLMDAGYHVYDAAFTLDFKIVEYFLERNYPVDAAHPLCKFTGLHIAVCFDDLDSFRVLLKYKANIKALDNTDASPLRCLYRGNKEHNTNKIEILKILLNSGISPTACGSEGIFEIGYTLIGGNQEAIRVVLQSNLDFTVKDRIFGRTILHYLAENTNPGVEDELESVNTVNTWCDVDAVDDRGLSPMAIAASKANVEMVKFLLFKGATPNPAQHQPPLYFVYTRWEAQLLIPFILCAELLLQFNSNLETVFTDENGAQVTLFDVAWKTNDIFRIKPLIEYMSLLEKSGSCITEKTRNTINSDSTLKAYYKECRQLLLRRIFGSITFFTLLCCDRKKMEKYLNNKELFREIKLFIGRHKLQFSYLHLFNRWRTRYFEGKSYKKIKQEAVKALLRIFGKYIIKNALILDHIIDYLDTQSLRQLTQV